MGLNELATITSSQNGGDSTGIQKPGASPVSGDLIPNHTAKRTSIVACLVSQSLKLEPLDGCTSRSQKRGTGATSLLLLRRLLDMTCFLKLLASLRRR